ncbi:MAG: J domain-containing protein [Caulobacteraceae bacterium]|nr:J domain-containing protein [Caulobacteraceae bacterium]
MSNAPSNYPLVWPAHRPRTKASARVKGGFVADKRSVTLAAASDKLEDQIERLGGRLPVLSSNIELRMDGRPRADRAPPADPGVCVYFELKGRPMAMACDAYTTVQQNIAAIANHIDAVRRQARYGVASAEESLQAFAALPSPSVIALGGRTAWQILGIERTNSRRAVNAAWRDRAEIAHPDKPGGSDAAMAELNAARDAALKEIDA